MQHELDHTDGFATRKGIQVYGGGCLRNRILGAGASILPTDPIHKGGDAAGVIPLTVGVDREEALVVMVVSVQLDVYPGVVFGLVERFETGRISVGRAGRVGRNMPVNDLAAVPGMSRQVGGQEVQRGRIDRAIELVQGDDMPASQVIAVVGQLLTADIGRMGIGSKVIPVGRPELWLVPL